jgi:hypothetical protein
MPAAAFAFSDDFNGTTLDSATWDLTDSGQATLQLGSGKLNYLASGLEADEFAVVDLLATNPGYGQNWEVIVDVTNTTPRSDPENEFTGAGIFVSNNDGSFEDAIFLELGNELSAGIRFFANFQTGGNESPDEDDSLPTITTSGSLRISYDGAAKVFSIWADPTGPADGFQWQLLSSYGIAGSGGIRNTNWGMSSSGTFLVSLYGLSSNLSVNSGGITFDNFHLNVGAPPAPQIAVTTDSVQLTIDPTINGRRYQVQKSETMTGNDWLDTGTEQTGTGAPLVITVPRNPLEPRCFYRVALDP